ncbi:MAG: HAMP domain-containing sensor histidine kinase [Prevotella sp.]|nr:HAMP domain-containing sensor histidine kinase [Prevotella sp.]
MNFFHTIEHIKVSLVVAAILIAVTSLFVSHLLTRDLQSEERNKMEVWAEAMRSLNTADETTDLSLVLRVLNGNHTIPVIVLDRQGHYSTSRNLSVPASDRQDSISWLVAKGKQMEQEGRSIRIYLNDADQKDYIDVCYDESSLLKRLAWYPYVQLGVVLLFVVVAIFALLTSKKAEQNKVWVGLSKETAHQLGTPISSLMAWTEMLKETYPQDDLIPEMDKDVKRLQLIAERFSKIGSLPEPVPTSLTTVIQHVTEYMDRRTSKKIQIRCVFPDHDITVRLSGSLFEWVIENLCKNAVDAMGTAPGQITITVGELPRKVYIEVADTGKGMRKQDMRRVFRPGFTTKKRGWGLGLSLAKRIVEEYHHGHIWVKRSEIGKGTTFRIEIPR